MEFEPFVLHWVLKRECCTVQRYAARKSKFTAVFIVAGNWAIDVSKLHSDLMFTSSFEFHLEVQQVIAFLEHCEREDCLFGMEILFSADFHPLASIIFSHKIDEL